MEDFDRKRKSRDWEVKPKDKLGSNFGIRVCQLPFKISPSEETPREMSSLWEDINFDILPEDAKKYYEQFEPLKVIEQPDDEEVWFSSKNTFVEIPLAKPYVPPYNALVGFQRYSDEELDFRSWRRPPVITLGKPSLQGENAADDVDEERVEKKTTQDDMMKKAASI